MTPLIKNVNQSEDRKSAPLIPLRTGTVFPHTETVLSFGRQKSLKAIEAAFESDRKIVLSAQKDPQVDNPKKDDIYQTGTIGHIERLLKTDGEVNALVKGEKRISITGYTQKNPYFVTSYEQVDEIEPPESEEVKVLTKHLTKQLKKAVKLGKSVDFLIFMRLMSGVEPSELTDQISALLDLKPEEQQDLLETIDVQRRMEKLAEYFSQEIKVLEIEKSIDTKTQQKFNKSMRKTVLKERLKTIQEELGEKGGDDEINELKKKIRKAQMPEEVEEKAKKELDRLSKMHAYNPEAGYIRTYIETLTDFPWNKESDNNVSLQQAEEVLKKDHYGLKEVKERILEHLAVMKLKEKRNNKEEEKTSSKGTIICFVGPPGVGKTSMGRSIARALDREFMKVSLGGIRDEAEIRGHRRTYVGAMPGRVIRGIIDVKSKNPVFMLDEIDKVGKDFRGDPSAALLELLDPEQNKEFFDHYFDVPVDLSNVLFITTANVLDTIPPALKDRLEVIRFSGYTENEKYKIAKQFLMEKVLKANGLKKDEINISQTVINQIIDKYTREAGVRELERKLSKLARKVAKKITEEEDRDKEVRITTRNVQKYLGPEKYNKRLAKEENEIGVATGMAWTQAGGEILFIETALMPGKGKVILTGQLGDVMKESCKAAISYARSNWKELGLDKDVTKEMDVHVHVPEGAVPKDGPSAGITIATAIISALTNKKVKRDVAMTGEITLRGKVLEIGGVKEKVIAAHRAGIKKILLPKDNEKNLVKVPDEIKEDTKFEFVENLEQVLEKTLVKN